MYITQRCSALVQEYGSEIDQPCRPHLQLTREILWDLGHSIRHGRSIRGYEMMNMRKDWTNQRSCTLARLLTVLNS